MGRQEKQSFPACTLRPGGVSLVLHLDVPSGSVSRLGVGEKVSYLMQDHVFLLLISDGKV